MYIGHRIQDLIKSKIITLDSFWIEEELKNLNREEEKKSSDEKQQLTIQT